MKKIIFLMALCCLYIFTALAQGINASVADLPLLLLEQSASLHLISAKPVRYFHSSIPGLRLEQPAEGLIRIGLADSLNIDDCEGILTLGTDRVYTQFRLICKQSYPDSIFRPVVRIAEWDWKPINDQEKTLSDKELKGLAGDLLKSRKGIFQTRANQYGIKARLNKVATMGDYIFIDMSFYNKSNIGYDIDQLSFSLEDKNIAKATNAQSVPVLPELSLLETDAFRRLYRNVFVFKKFTFPGNKILQVNLREKQLSRRAISFPIRYSDILNADVIVY